MKNARSYGVPPFSVVVVHGGPGATGEMAPVAHELAISGRGVLEPFQTEASLKGQVEELKNVLEQNCVLPVVMIGFSWGAWLAGIVAARYPSHIKKLILIASGGFDDTCAARTWETRLARLDEREREEVKSLIEKLEGPESEEQSTAFERLGRLFSRIDAYDPLPIVPDETDPGDCRADIFRGVWKDAAALRKSGKLLEIMSAVQCPVVAIHGDYDPHPAHDVRSPLSAVLGDFRFFLLEKCGHTPWIERWARENFYKILKDEL